ncbi:CRS2-associated factor 2, mitochondrial-like [Actinidia eriantha]|uniref:CRS2-associated factor 2, mitochondrial-like n=1 Tax=Actinidia eriantha TaxID=165200 RepID=UPI00258684DA|nr:CRS2-associated factor 2, mitochondrial-like [Actinidia eriantha]
MEPNEPLYQTRPESNCGKESSDLPFDFKYSYSETNPSVEPIGFREPLRFSPFGPGRLDRNGSALALWPTEPLIWGSLMKSEMLFSVNRPPRKKWPCSWSGIATAIAPGRLIWELKQLVVLSDVETPDFSHQCNGGVTHNMIEDIYSHWKHSEAVRINCLGVPTLDMDNVLPP